LLVVFHQSFIGQRLVVRPRARETEPVKPVDRGDVDAVVALVSRPVAAMIRLQLLTGALPGPAPTTSLIREDEGLPHPARRVFVGLARCAVAGRTSSRPTPSFLIMTPDDPIGLNPGCNTW